MTIDQLRAAREATPFIPFTIHLAGGRTHRVPHRDYLSLQPGGRVVHIYGPGDAWSFLDAYLITELSFDPAAPASS